MTEPPPPSPLITPDMRRRLAQRYEEAVRLASEAPRDFARIHELLAECLRADPGNILYLDEFIANLRRWKPQAARSWLPSWLRGASGTRSPTKDAASPVEFLRSAPELLREGYDDARLLGRLAAAAGECNLDEVELMYWSKAVQGAPDDADSLRGLARCLTRCGRFEEALEIWRKVAATAPDDEVAQAIDDLSRPPENANQGVPPEAIAADVDVADVDGTIRLAEKLLRRGQFAEADDLLRRVLSAAGGDLRVHEALENTQLARAAHQVEIARRRAARDEHPKAQSLVGRLEQEHNRLAIDIYHVRSERHPNDPSLRLELARRLKWAGNYSGAIQRLEEARALAETKADRSLASEALLELGECWQHLRQFDKALAFYREAVTSAELATQSSGGSRPPLATCLAALYRIGVLAAAMNNPAEAKAALTRLVALDPNYKDARQRLDNLP
jgi:tetratricopeptide (TPR) repeat protein